MANQKKTYPIRNPDNFLEALRGLGGGVAEDIKSHVTAAIKSDIPQAFGFSGTGELKPNQSFSVDDLKQAEKVGERKAETRFNNRLDQERTIWLRSEQQNKTQIQSIINEIQSLSKVTGELAKEVQVASFMAPANPGVYHKNFFEQLRAFIQTIRLKVQESKHWLATTNSRAKKQKGYWGQVQQSGTKFMLSSERYMVTSTG